jgi:hypothetical protein
MQGFKLKGWNFGIQGVGVGFGLKAEVLELVEGLGFRVWALGFGVWG